MHTNHVPFTTSSTVQYGLVVLVLGAMWPVIAFSSAVAQPGSDSTHVPTIGVLVQASAHAESHPTLYTNGFGVDRARFVVSGEPVEGVSYELEGDFVDDLIVTDAHVDLQLHPRWMLRGGQFRPAFSYGQLVSSSATPFVLRARGVRALGVSRTPGAMVSYQSRSAWRVQAGVFNGARLGARSTRPEPPAQSTAEEQLLYVGRLAWMPEWDTGRVALGAGVAHDPAGAGAQNGPSTRYSGNVHIQHRAVGLTVEALTRTAAAPGGMETGAYATGTYQVASAHTLRARTDWVRYNEPAPEVPMQLGVGYTYQPTSYLRVETDAVAPIEDRAVHPVVMRTQLQLHF